MITHGNIVATAAAVMTVIPKLGSSDVYLAYLPLAHVFEMAAEVYFKSPFVLIVCDVIGITYFWFPDSDAGGRHCYRIWFTIDSDRYF